MVKLTIHGILPGLNEYINAERSNRYAAAAMKKQCEHIIITEAKRQIGRKLKTPVTLNYIWYEKNRRRDKDNISGYGHKVIQDSLVKAGLLDNDGWDDIDGSTDSYIVDKNNPRVVIMIKEAEE